jgi:hypothetical protein
MTSTPALQWLQAEFEQAATHRRWKSPDRHCDPHWHGGPTVIRPMIQLRTITHGGTPMTVTYADYADPDRWWL